MTIATTARPRVAERPRTAVWQLALIEGRRMLRHPAPWAGLLLTFWWSYAVFDEPWATARYEGLVASVAPLLLGVSLASVSAFGRELVPVSEDAPMDRPRRAAARLLGGLALVGLVAACVAGAWVWLRVRGGLALGDEPGRTLHAHYSLPELLQPVVLACLAVAAGAAIVHLVRQRLVASIVLFVGWFLFGATYWMFNGDVVRWLTPVQVQPLFVDVGPATTDPTTFPSSWLLSVPGEFQENWARLVVSPSMAAWHDVYLVGLTAMLLAVAVPGRARRPLLAAGVALAVLGVLVQRSVTP
jgi:hypothetical protein